LSGQIVAGSANSADFFLKDTLDGVFTVGKWHHIAASLNTNFPAGQKVATLYLDGSPVPFDDAVTNDTTGAFVQVLTGGYCGVPNPGSVVPIGNNYDPEDLADLQIWEGQYIDLTQPANLQKLISGGKPVDPKIAAAAFGPLTVLFSGDATTFGTNQGTGGAFTLTGPGLTNADTSPSN
jgi:hypothetical protein